MDRTGAADKTSPPLATAGLASDAGCGDDAAGGPLSRLLRECDDGLGDQPDVVPQALGDHVEVRAQALLQARAPVAVGDDLGRAGLVFSVLSLAVVR